MLFGPSDEFPAGPIARVVTDGAFFAVAPGLSSCTVCQSQKYSLFSNGNFVRRQIANSLMPNASHSSLGSANRSPTNAQVADPIIQGLCCSLFRYCAHRGCCRWCDMRQRPLSPDCHRQQHRQYLLSRDREMALRCSHPTSFSL